MHLRLPFCKEHLSFSRGAASSSLVRMTDNPYPAAITVACKTKRAGKGSVTKPTSLAKSWRKRAGLLASSSTLSAVLDIRMIDGGDEGSQVRRVDNEGEDDGRQTFCAGFVPSLPEDTSDFFGLLCGEVPSIRLACSPR